MSALYNSKYCAVWFLDKVFFFFVLLSSRQREKNRKAVYSCYNIILNDNCITDKVLLTFCNIKCTVRINE